MLGTGSLPVAALFNRLTRRRGFSICVDQGLWHGAERQTDIDSVLIYNRVFLENIKTIAIWWELFLRTERREEGAISVGATSSPF